MSFRNLTIGTRGSALALWQANHIADRLRGLVDGLSVELMIIKTKGDKILDVPLAKVGGKGLFVKEIEEALLRKDVDLAVHSMKDVPSEMVPELILSAIPEREDPRDALVSKGISVADLPDGAVVGTSSLRRRCQLAKQRPDLKIKDLRGNVGTRLGKLDAGEFDAILLAAAGLKRLGFSDRITEALDYPAWIPAVGQGALGIQSRTEDAELNELLTNLHHAPTACCVRAERSLLLKLEGGCQVPIAAFGVLDGDTLTLEGLVGHPSGDPMFRTKLSGSADEPEELGEKVAKALLAMGAKKVLEEVYASSQVEGG